MQIYKTNKNKSADFDITHLSLSHSNRVSQVACLNPLIRVLGVSFLTKAFGLLCT